jgi:hypothetical protein
MRKILILFLLIPFALFSQEIKVGGSASIILNNKKDINHVDNAIYKNKLINDAIKNAINQAISFTVQIDENSEIDFDEANKNSIPRDRFNLKLTSGLIVEWRIEGVPYIYKDLRTKNKWNCKVSGFVKELENAPKSNIYSLKPEVEKRQTTPADWVCSLGFGMSLPQTFAIPLQSEHIDPLPKWSATMYSTNYFGITFGLRKDLDLALGLNISFSNFELRTKDINNVEMFYKTTLYGGRIDIGTFKKTINPRGGIFLLTGNIDDDICTLTGAFVGIDFLKGRFKIGPELQIYFVNSTYSQDGIEFKNNNLFMPNSDIKFNAGINFKLFL